MKKLVIVVVLLSVLSIFFGCAQTKKIKLDPRAISGAEIHMAPTEWSLINEVLPPNSEIQNIESIEEGWVKIKTNAIPGHGWFFAGLIGMDNSVNTNAEIIGPYTYKVIRDDTPVRKEPDIFSPEITKLMRGDKVLIVAKQGWWYITDNEQFILADLVYQDEPL